MCAPAGLPLFRLHHLALTFIPWCSPAVDGERQAEEEEQQQQASPLVVLDGANLLWAYGHALARRFGCKVYPASAGLLVALNYEVRRGVLCRPPVHIPLDCRPPPPPLRFCALCDTHFDALLTAVAGCRCAHHSAAALQLRAQ